MSMLVQLFTHTSSPTFTTTSSEVSLLGWSLEHLAKPSTEMAKRSKWTLFDHLPTPLLRFPIILSHNYVLIPQNVHPPKNISFQVLYPAQPAHSSIPGPLPPACGGELLEMGAIHHPVGGPRTTYHRPPTAPGRHTPGLGAPQRFSILRPMYNNTWILLKIWITTLKAEKWLWNGSFFLENLKLKFGQYFEVEEVIYHYLIHFKFLMQGYLSWGCHVELLGRGVDSRCCPYCWYLARDTYTLDISPRGLMTIITR